MRVGGRSGSDCGSAGAGLYCRVLRRDAGWFYRNTRPALAVEPSVDLLPPRPAIEVLKLRKIGGDSRGMLFIRPHHCALFGVNGRKKRHIGVDQRLRLGRIEALQFLVPPGEAGFGDFDFQSARRASPRAVISSSPAPLASILEARELRAGGLLLCRPRRSLSPAMSSTICCSVRSAGAGIFVCFICACPLRSVIWRASAMSIRPRPAARSRPQPTCLMSPTIPEPESLTTPRGPVLAQRPRRR